MARDDRNDGEESGWPQPAKVRARIRLDVGGSLDDDDDEAITNFSAASRIGNTLFLAADERAVVDRLTPGKHNSWTGHTRFPLADLLDLADPGEEADLEGLAAQDDWLWVLGSHARTRPKPEKAKDECIDLAELADLKDTRPRCLLARLPLVEDGDALMPVAADGKRKAGLLEQTKHGNCLAKALRKDPLIGPFTRIPAKEGGLDIEGIAVCEDRVALGLRGPVIATHAVLLELKIDAKKSGRLEFKGEPVKRLLAMEGLGIRDLKRCGDDLLILAGPSTSLSGPCALYRWRDWELDPPEDAKRVRLHRPERLFDIPFGRGVDHPEGLALWDEQDGEARQILVIYDSPSKRRCDTKRNFIDADLFDLPA
jgi:Protein of unknown function (DUF3616)